MQFVYKPEGAEPKKWEFEPDKLMSPEAEALERLTGFTYVQWADKVVQGSVLALHGLLYVMLKRGNPTLKWDEVQFSMSEVDFELGDKEAAATIAAYEARVDAGETLPDDEQETLDSLRAQVAEEDGPKGD